MTKLGTPRTAGAGFSPSGEPGRLSREGRKRMKSVPFEPLFIADWRDPVFLHFRIAPEALQPLVPFALDTLDGEAFFTLVAFSMRDMRFGFGGRLTRWMTRPIATHDFLNLRTYVRHRGEPGIHFVAEWLNDRIATRLGPITFGLPYRYGKLTYRIDHTSGDFRGEVGDGKAALRFSASARPESPASVCAPGTPAEFFLERYTAFTGTRLPGFFRVWHEPWLQKPLRNIELEELGLVEAVIGHRDFECIGGHVSTGSDGVWMGRPHLL